MRLLPVVLPLLKALVAGLFIALGVLTFDQELSFAVLYIAMLVVIGVLGYQEYNILGVLLVMLVFQLMLLLAVPIVGSGVVDRLVIYLALGVLLWQLEDEEYRWWLLSALAVIVAVEGAWLYQGYTAPDIHWYVLQIGLNVGLRHFLFTRIFMTSRLFPGQAQPLVLDLKLRQLAWIFILVHLAVIGEYLVRHLLGAELLVVYYSSTYVFHALSVYSAWLILTQSAHLLAPKLFKF